MESCGDSGVASSLKQTYCGKPDQQQHGSQHRLICKAGPAESKDIIEEQENDSLGRYLVAATDISEETILFKDTPLVVGPPSGSPPLCLGCLRLGPLSSCPKCGGGVPVCHPRCKHFAPECDAIQKAKLPFDAVRLSHCILPLRCLLNVRSPNERWKTFLRLEAHLDVRRHLPVWNERNRRVVQVLRDHGLAASDGSENELLQRICGILDVNSFEIRGPDGGILRAIFPRAALMAHSCVANVHVAVDDNQVMTVRAARRIQTKDTLYYCYTSVLQGTAARQEHLWEGKYFRCKCRRCEDPSELGIHVGSIWCPRCVVGLVTPGPFHQSSMSDVVVKAKMQRCHTFRQYPIQTEQWLRRGNARSSKMESLNQASSRRWQCSDCKYLFSTSMIRTVENVSLDMVDSAVLNDGSSQIADRLQKVLKKLQSTLSPQHAVILHGKQLLGGAYRDRITETLTSKRQGVNLKLVGESAELCRELAIVLSKLECGAINRNVGIAFHGLYEALLLTFANRNVKGSELVKGLSEIQQVLEAALRHLRVEPPESPEGRLAAAAYAQLADVRDRLQNADQRPSQNSRLNKKNKKKKKKNR